MSVHQPVGISTSFATSTTSAQSTAIAKKSNALRIVSVGADAHVAIGTFPLEQRQVTTFPLVELLF